MTPKGLYQANIQDCQRVTARGRIDYTRLHNVTHSVEEPYQTRHLPSEDMGDSFACVFYDEEY